MKILIRSNEPSVGVPTISEILVNDYIGDNIGNQLYLNSIIRWLQVDESTEFTKIRTTKYFTDQEVEIFNSEYDIFVIPLANAFRDDFIHQLEIITNLVERLTIPCVVACVGVQRFFDQHDLKFEYDGAVTNFVKAVLKKSAMLGVRGEITAQYLKNLGFREEEDFTVIGCPSLYTYGYVLPEPRVNGLTKDSSVVFHSNMSDSFYSFFEREAGRFKDSAYICTTLNEFRFLYAGYPFPKKDVNSIVPESYPLHFNSELIRQDRIVSFVDEYSWLKYLKEKDFVFGSRLHGTFASILAGTPCVLFAFDDRCKELADYHNAPYVYLNDVKDTQTIFDIYEHLDFTSILKGQKSRVDHYVDFLDKNGIKHLQPMDLEGETPFDRGMYSLQRKGEIHHFINQSPEEQQRRLEEYYLAMWRQKHSFEEQGKRLKSENDKLNKRNEKLNNQNDKLNNQNEKLKEEIKRLKNSKFYKAGKKYHSFIKLFKG